jgi:hypothetical protein
MGKIRPTTSKNQDHPLLNYLSKNTPSKLKNNFMLLAKKLEQEVQTKEVQAPFNL